MSNISIDDLKKRQELSLQDKIELSNIAIQQWYEYWEGQVYISFSGGKDSTVLLDLVRTQFPEVPAVFIDTGLEYPEIKEFVRTIDNVVWLRPKIPFHKVIKKYGWPVISKENSQKIEEIRNTKSKKLLDKRLHGDANGWGKLPNKYFYLINAPFLISAKCCNKLKKDPAYRYEKETNRKPFLGDMAVDSLLRQHWYIRHQCNGLTLKRPVSNPLGFWTVDNIWNYIKDNKIRYSKIYDMGHDRTCCMFCMFGQHLNTSQNNRFQKMQKTHPKLWEYCIYKLGAKDVLEFIHIPYKYYSLGLDLKSNHLIRSCPCLK